MFDLLIRNGTVIDGSGAPAIRADVAVTGDRIAAVDQLTELAAAHTIDATGLVVSPGFIDVHTHADGWLSIIPNLAPKTTQGITTEVLMSDGISYAPFFLQAEDGIRCVAVTGVQTCALPISRRATSIRLRAGFPSRPPDDPGTARASPVPT